MTLVFVSEKMADQNERAFQKQPTIFLNKKGGLKPSESRFFCNPGLGFKTPVEAKNGNYIGKKCPFTGKVCLDQGDKMRKFCLVLFKGPTGQIRLAASSIFGKPLVRKCLAIDFDFEFFIL